MHGDKQFEKLFHAALRIRLVEERVIELYPSDKIQSPVHLSIGQEAVAVGVCEPLAVTDLLFFTYRSHAFYLAKGGDLGQFFAELYGKVTGCCKGKGGSMHLAAPEVGVMGCSAVVASTIPHAVGAALAAQRLMKRQVVVVVFGDGAPDEGVYHESLNFAALHKVPIVFICENNGLAVHSRAAARQAYRIVEHARAYGLPATRLSEGYDFMAVAEATGKAVAAVKAGAGPQFLEILTYRYREHVGPGDDHEAGYRSRSELEQWMANDPLAQRNDLVEKHRAAILREIDAALAFAEQSSWPAASELLEDVL